MPTGRPHAMPVWGLWREASLWFSSSRSSRKARKAFSVKQGDFTGSPTRWSFDD